MCRKELATLSPQSFNFDSEPVTLTVEAACSKHRRKDVLPLHPEFLPELIIWLAGLGDDELLFPKLAKRRTWLIVKKDLERVGIAYETADGNVDFHAAGRHTHITELLRNGASVTEAKKLARHRDVRMTMKYKHIGIEDQARALSNLPVPGHRDSDDALRIRGISRVTDSQSLSPDGTDGEPQND